MQKIVDHVGVVVSVVCAVHCAILPVLASALPIVATSASSEVTFHKMMLFVVLPSCLVSSVLGCRKHGNFLIAFVYAIGVSLITFAALLNHEALGETGERLVTTLGGLVLTYGHVYNYITCRRTECNH